MNKKAERIGIVIVNYKTPIHLAMCLLSVSHFVDSYELVIVDNGEDEESKKVIEPWESKAHVYYQRNIGFCKSVNKAIKHFRSEYFAIVPADCIVTLNWKIKLLQAIKELPKAGIVACMATQTSGPQGIESAGMIPRPTECQRIILNAAMLRTETFKSLGGLDDEFPNKGGNFSDDDLARRYYIAGYKNYIIPEIVFHMRSASYQGDVAAYKQDIFLGRDYYTKKWALK